VNIPSLGFESIQDLIAESQSLSFPASNRSQLVWQRCHSPLLSCTCAVNIRTPALRATVALKYLVLIRC
jgi:hypothetical protein